MPTVRLRLRQSAAVIPFDHEAPAFLLANLRNSYFPGKGIPLSLLIHGILFCILFFLRAPKDMLATVRPPEKETVIQQNEPKVVMYLPLIGGGNLGMIFPAPKAPKPAKRPPVASSPKPKGLSYPGRQEMISDPPEPTNQIQTLEQPALESPPILPPPLLLPNIVQIAEAQADPSPEPPAEPEKIPEQIKPVEPPPSRPPSQIKPPPPPPVRPPPAPKPVEPPTTNPPKEEKPEEPPAIKPVKPEEPPQAKPAEPPKPVEPPPLPAPAVELEIPAVAPMELPFSVAQQISVEVPKVILPPLIPPKPEKLPEPVSKKEPAPKPEPPPKTEIVPKTERAPKPEPVPPKASSTMPERAPEALPKSKVAVPVTEKRNELPSAPQDPADRDRGVDQQDILALTPMPAPLPKTLVVPRGEARGRFMISPEPNLAGTEGILGSKSGAEDTVPVAENRSDATPVQGVTQADPMPTVVDVGPMSGSAKSKEAVGTDTRKINPKAKVVTGIQGAGSRSSISGDSKGGSTPGRGIGTGVGSGSGPGKKKPFSGITIVGGAYDPGVAAAEAAPVVQARRPMQTAYGVTVISTENSGGGLPNMGVFSGEQIYTVYLDMRRDESDASPSWTLEFAVHRNPSNPENAPANTIRNQEGLVLPFPIEKESPPWPTDLVAKYRGRQVVIYAIINTEGKMTSITVKDSPDILLNEPLLRALGKWVFRPAQFQGAPIAVKALMGIPLWIPE